VRAQRRRRAHLRHVQRRLRGQLPLRQCLDDGLLRRWHCPRRTAARGRRARGGRGAQEEAAAAGAELQVQGGGGEPADDAHRRGAQPPAPDERVPRRAPVPHAGGVRPEGTFTSHTPRLSRSTKPAQLQVFFSCLLKMEKAMPDQLARPNNGKSAERDPPLLLARAVRSSHLFFFLGQT
jgi:hypothetical protein